MESPDQLGPQATDNPADNPAQDVEQPPAAPQPAASATPPGAAGPEPTTDPGGAPPAPEPQPARTYAGVYESPEALEQGYTEARAAISRQGAENAELRRQLEVATAVPPEPEVQALSHEELVQLQYGENPQAYYEALDTRYLTREEAEHVADVRFERKWAERQAVERFTDGLLQRHPDMEPHMEYVDTIAVQMKDAGQLAGLDTPEQVMDTLATETRKRLDAGQSAQPAAQPPPVSPPGGTPPPPSALTDEPVDMDQARRDAVADVLDD